MHNCSYKINSRIKEDSVLVREAQKAGKNKQAQADIDGMYVKLKNGNLNPGKGSRSIGFGNIQEARGQNGGRIYFRVKGESIEILAKSDKGNQKKVIERLRELYK